MLRWAGFIPCPSAPPSALRRVHITRGVRCVGARVHLIPHDGPAEEQLVLGLGRGPTPVDRSPTCHLRLGPMLPQPKFCGQTHLGGGGSPCPVWPVLGAAADTGGRRRCSLQNTGFPEGLQAARRKAALIVVA